MPEHFYTMNNNHKNGWLDLTWNYSRRLWM